MDEKDFDQISRELPYYQASIPPQPKRSRAEAIEGTQYPVFDYEEKGSPPINYTISTAPTGSQNRAERLTRFFHVRLGEGIQETPSSTNPSPHNTPYFSCDKTYSNPSEELIKELESQLKEVSLVHHEWDFLSTISPPQKRARLLGVCLYYSEHHPEILLNIIQNKITEESLITRTFEADLAHLRERLLDYLRCHQRTRLQSAICAYQVRLPVELSCLLITKSGKINTGLIPFFLAHFVSCSSQLYSLESHLWYTLNAFYTSKHLRNAFEAIEAPTKKEIPSNYVVRTLLHLPPSAPIGPVEVKQAILSTLLTHSRQGESGSCFATSLAIALQTSRIDLCLKDLATLIRKGKLIREINGITTQFPFLTRVGLNGSDQNIVITPQGLLQGPNNTHLFEAPGIAAAMNAMSISSSEGEQWLAERFGENPSPLHELAIARLIYELAQFKAKQTPSLSLENLFLKGRFAFETETSNALFEVWTNAIAGMAEGQENSMIKTALHQSFYRAVMDIQDSNIREWLRSHPNFLNSCQKELIDRVQMHYDPRITKDISQDSCTVRGGFILYDRTLDHLQGVPPKKIANHHEFQCFLSNIVLDQLQKIPNTSDALKVSFKTNLQNFSFLVSLLRYFHPDNRQTKIFPETIESLSFCPWQVKSGNSSVKVHEVFMGKEPHFLIKTKPVNTEDLLQTIVHASTEIRAHWGPAAPHPFLRVPLRLVGTHTCSLLPCHPSLCKATGTEKEQYNLHLEKLQRISEKIANLTLSDDLKTNCCDALSQIISKDENNSFQRLRPKLEETPCTYREFRSQLADFLASSPKNEILLRQIDSFLCTNLPKPWKDMLHQTSIHFADTNWEQEGFDLHFVFLVNPGTGGLEMWQAREDGEHYIALDHHWWVTGHEWRISFPL